MDFCLLVSISVYVASIVKMSQELERILKQAIMAEQ